MRVAIVGSRAWPRPWEVAEAVAALPADTVVVSGAAPGVDSWALCCADEVYGLKWKAWPADWKRLGRAAGVIRNRDIVNDCDRMIAFHVKDSRGTADSIAYARAKGKPVELHR